MLQQITIQTSYLERFKPLLETALDREAKLLEYSIQRTREALAPFEDRYKMSTDEFERKFNDGTLGDERTWFDWLAEVEAARHLKAKVESLRKLP